MKFAFLLALTLCLSCTPATQAKVNTAVDEADRIFATVCGQDRPIATCAQYVEQLINALSVRRSLAIGRSLGTDGGSSE